MLVVWSINLAKKYLHLLCALLKEVFQLAVLTAADVVLQAPVSLQLLPLDITQWALKFIATETIPASPMEKFLLDGELSLPVVNTICCAVEQASWIPSPAVAAPPWTETFTVATTPQTEAPVAALPLATRTLSAPTLPATTQCSPLITVTKLPIIEALCPVNDNVSIIKELQSPRQPPCGRRRP
uniref:Uncharacterized protein n=1 Tax=Romanomermis culicivorax TaxID=13658 RepID=A0A915JBE1_ROMCU